MIIYYILLFVIVAVGIALCGYKPTRRKEIIYCVLMAAALSAISGLRFMVGTDYLPYWTNLHTCYFYSWDEFSVDRFEKGYLSIVRLIGDLTLEHNLLFIFFAVLFAVTVTVYIYKYSSNLWMSFLAFIVFGFLYNSMCFMRQYTALLIVMLALPFLEKNHFFRYSILIFFATCFHMSAIIMIPLYFILKIPLNKFVLPIYLLISGICFAYSDKIVSYVTRFFYKGYANSVELTNGTHPGTFIGFLIFLIVILIARKWLVQRNPYNSLLVNMLYFGVFFEFIGIKHAVVSRFAIFLLIPAIILLVAELFELLVDKVRTMKWAKNLYRVIPVMVSIVIIVPTLILHQYFMIFNYNGVVPYISIFSEVYQQL